MPEQIAPPPMDAALAEDLAQAAGVLEILRTELSGQVGDLDTLQQDRILGICRLRKAQVGQCVLMSAIHLGCLIKGSQFTQRCDHILRCPLEQPAASGGKQRIATEQDWRIGRLAVESDVIEGMARHFDDREA